MELTIAQVETALKSEKEKRKDFFAKQTGLGKDQILIVGDDRVVLTAKTLEEMKNVLNAFETYSNGVILNHGSKKIYLTSRYRLDIANNYHDRLFKVSFENMIGKIEIEINFDFLPEDFKLAYFNAGSRGLFDTETHYVNIPAHHKKFQRIRIPAYFFKGDNVKWYGGYSAMTNDNQIGEIVECIKR